jgi:RNA polymerase sigma-70 factor (ECF subfamily)
VSAVARARFAEAKSDAALFEEMAEGDLGALGALFDRHHASVRSFLSRVLCGSADVDDLVQETFLTASRTKLSFDEGDTAKPFLLGVAAQLARRKRRSFARLRAMLERVAFAPPPVTKSPEDDALHSERARLVNDALAQLSHEHREALLLVDLGSLSGVDAAKALGIPPGTIWRRLHEARTELSARVQRRSP